MEAALELLRLMETRALTEEGRTAITARPYAVASARSASSSAHVPAREGGHTPAGAHAPSAALGSKKRRCATARGSAGEPVKAMYSAQAVGESTCRPPMVRYAACSACGRALRACERGRARAGQIPGVT
jgi:hypothetical protein